MMHSDVLIVGAGPTGLVLALWLTRLGVKVRIIDKTAEPGLTSRALAVQARTLELYRQLDLTDVVLKLGHKVPAVNLWVKGEPATRLSFERIGPDLTPYSFLHIFPQDQHERLLFPQDQHERVLIERLETLGVSVERRTELASFTEQGRRVIARLRGPQRREETCEAWYIAGCDGAHSTVRETIGIGFPGGTYRQVFYVADVEAAPMLSPQVDRITSRRLVLQFLVASPLFTGIGSPAFAQNTSAPPRLPDPMVWAPRDLDKLIADPKEALDVFDFEPVAKKNVPPAHFGYMVTGIDDEVTLRANREGFLKFQLRPRRLVDVSTIDITTEILGTKYDSPIVIAPISSNCAFHPDGEVAVARAARTGNHLQMLSTVATTSIEDAIAARGAPVWFRLYPTRKWEVAEALVRRAERAGSPVIVVTVDGPAPVNWETLVRLRRTDTRQCDGCHGRTFQDYVARKPNFDGINVSGVPVLNAANLTWDSIKRLRDAVKTKIMLKGILTREDAKLAADYGTDGPCQVNLTGSKNPKRDAQSHRRGCIPPSAGCLGSENAQG